MVEHLEEGTDRRNLGENLQYRGLKSMTVIGGSMAAACRHSAGVVAESLCLETQQARKLMGIV